MKKEKENRINENMEDVINSSKEIRNYLLDADIPDEEKKDKLKVLRTALDANKNIVSASCVLISVEELVK